MIAHRLGEELFSEGSVLKIAEDLARRAASEVDRVAWACLSEAERQTGMDWFVRRFRLEPVALKPSELSVRYEPLTGLDLRPKRALTKVIFAVPFSGSAVLLHARSAVRDLGTWPATVLGGEDGGQLEIAFVVVTQGSVPDQLMQRLDWELSLIRDRLEDQGTEIDLVNSRVAAAIADRVDELLVHAGLNHRLAEGIQERVKAYARNKVD